MDGICAGKWDGGCFVPVGLIWGVWVECGGAGGISHAILYLKSVIWGGRKNCTGGRTDLEGITN